MEVREIYHCLVLLLILPSDNNDGISVIDVTDPSNPSYCFISFHGHGEEWDVPRYIPLTATEYVRDYHPVLPEEYLEDPDYRRREDSVLKTIAALDGERVIDLGMLAEAWPEYQKNWKKAQRKHPTASTSLAASPVEYVLIPSLTELTLKPALDHALEIGDTHQLDELVWMPDKGNALRAALLDRDDKPFPDTGVSLLIKILGELNLDTLDLVGIHLLAPQIIDIASQMHTRTTIENLKLSRNSVITAEGICEILRAIPTIRRLWLLDTNISSEDMIQFLRDQPEVFYGIETIVHPAFMTMHSTSPYPTAFRFYSVLEYRKPSFSLPFFTPSSILQSLMDILAVFAYGTGSNPNFLLQSEMVPHIALASSRSEGQKWSERFVHLIPHWQGSPKNYTAEKGWGFVIKNVSMEYGIPKGKPRYAFTKTLVIATEPSTAGKPEKTDSETGKRAETTAKIATYDFDSFLKAMREEGRPEPSESLVKAFADVLKKLEEGDAKFMMDEKELMEILGI